MAISSTVLSRARNLLYVLALLLFVLILGQKCDASERTPLDKDPTCLNACRKLYGKAAVGSAEWIVTKDSHRVLKCDCVHE